MNIKLIILAGIALVIISGCGNTADGVKKDSEINGQETAERSQSAMKNAEETGKAITAASMLTPKIKLALTADKLLNDPKNLIDVDSTDEKVTLIGHVTSEDLKKLAGDITAKILTESGAKQPLDNKLEIQP